MVVQQTIYPQKVGLPNPYPAPIEAVYIAQVSSNTNVVGTIININQPNDCLYVGVFLSQISQVVNSVTLNGVSLNPRGSVTGSSTRISVWYGIEQAVTSATLNVTLNTSGNPWTVEALVIQNRVTPNPFDGNLQTATGNSQVISKNITTLNPNDLLVAFACQTGSVTLLPATDGFSLVVSSTSQPMNPSGQAEYLPIGSLVTNYSVAFQASSAGNWALTVDALEQANFPTVLNLQGGEMQPILIGTSSVGANVVVNLPQSVTVPGLKLTIKKTDAESHSVILTAASGDLIDGQSTYPIYSQYGYASLIADGVNNYFVEQGNQFNDVVIKNSNYLAGCGIPRILRSFPTTLTTVSAGNTLDFLSWTPGNMNSAVKGFSALVLGHLKCQTIVGTVSSVSATFAYTEPGQGLSETAILFSAVGPSQGNDFSFAPVCPRVRPGNILSVNVSVAGKNSYISFQGHIHILDISDTLAETNNSDPPALIWSDEV